MSLLQVHFDPVRLRIVDHNLTNKFARQGYPGRVQNAGAQEIAGRCMDVAIKQARGELLKRLPSREGS